MSGSASGRRRGITSTIVTDEPSLAMAWPSSRAIGPPPITTSRRGSSVARSRSSLVQYATASRPGMRGTVGAAPVVTSTVGADSSRVPTVTVVESENAASPSTISTPSSDSTYPRAPFEPRLTMSRTRVMTAAKSTSTVPTRTPNSEARRASCAISALRMRAFDGMQPRVGHVPPNSARSMTAMRRPSPTARPTALMPAIPAPMTIRSCVCMESLRCRENSHPS